MPRVARLHAPAIVHHVVARFVNRDFLFDSPGAREKFLSIVPAAIRGTGWLPLSYALMSSHSHLTFEAGPVPAWVVMQRLHTAFAKWLNRTLGRLGPVFAGRYHDVLVAPNAALIVVGYGHNNPVRAGLVSAAVDSDWTSHRAYVGLATPPPWLEVERGLQLCGLGTSARDRAEFDALVRAAAANGRDELLTGEVTARVRRSARASAEAPVEVTEPVVGIDRGASTSRIEILARSGLPPELLARPDPQLVVRCVEEVLGLRSGSLRSRARVRALVDGRRIALAAWVLGFGGKQRAMADALGMSEAGASQLVRREWASIDARVAQAIDAICARLAAAA